VVKPYAEEARWIESRLSRFPDQLQKAQTQSEIETVYGEIATFLDDVDKYAQELDLTATARTVKWARTWAADKKASILIDALFEMNRHLRQDLEGRHFLFVPNERLESYYIPGSALLGPDVRARFPSAVLDIEEASKALAFGLSTAAVFHLMRVVESGLRELSGVLGIALQPNWGQYIQAFNDAVKNKRKRKGVSWRRDAPFYTDIAGDLELIKSAWRNPTMHLERYYTSDEADLIFKATKSFMQRLATK